MKNKINKTDLKLHPKKCKMIFERCRWNNEQDNLKPRCPYCKEDKIYKHHYNAKKHKAGYKCNECDYTFNIFTKTFLHGAKLDMTKIMLILFKYRKYDMNTSNTPDRTTITKKEITKIIKHISEEINIDARTTKRTIVSFTSALNKQDSFARLVNRELVYLIRDIKTMKIKV